MMMVTWVVMGPSLLGPTQVTLLCTLLPHVSVRVSFRGGKFIIVIIIIILIIIVVAGIFLTGLIFVSVLISLGLFLLSSPSPAPILRLSHTRCEKEAERE